jgi:iron complex transport system ATP-binding protein
MSASAGPATAPIEAQHICVQRGDKRVLDDVSVSLQSGLTAVIGPNGAGKSTLLQVLAGLVRPNVGHVLVDGIAIEKIKPKRLAQQRSYLPQNARCEWPIGVERVIALGLTPNLPPVGGLAPSDQARLCAALSAWDLCALRKQSALTLSGGELMRTMLARALVSDPRIILADEPIAGLDPRHALDAMARLADLARKGRSVVVAIHDLALAARYADRVIALKGGRLFAEGLAVNVLTPAAIRELFEVDARVAHSERGLELTWVGDAASRHDERQIGAGVSEER